MWRKSNENLLLEEEIFIVDMSTYVCKYVGTHSHAQIYQYKIQCVFVWMFAENTSFDSFNTNIL